MMEAFFNERCEILIVIHQAYDVVEKVEIVHLDGKATRIIGTCERIGMAYNYSELLPRLADFLHRKKDSSSTSLDYADSTTPGALTYPEDPLPVSQALKLRKIRKMKW
jgi:hypothetical protein